MIIHIDFEKSYAQAVLSTFPNTSIMCRMFHLGRVEIVQGQTMDQKVFMGISMHSFTMQDIPTFAFFLTC
jgi:hypothetical protein